MIMMTMTMTIVRTIVRAMIEERLFYELDENIEYVERPRQNIKLFLSKLKA
jgi:hypothetical protein